MATTINGVALDWKAQEVLEAIVENGGEADTTEVKAYTGLERNEVVKYRFAKLHEARLVETHQPRSQNGRPAAKVVSLTDWGEDLLGDEGFDLDVESGDDDLTIDERVERLEKQVGRMRDTYGQVKQRIVELEEEVEAHDDDLDDLAGKIDDIQQFLTNAAERGGGDGE